MSRGLRWQRERSFWQRLLQSNAVDLAELTSGRIETVGDAVDALLRDLSRHDGPLETWRNSYLDQLAADNSFEAVLTVGSAARDATTRWPGKSAFNGGRRMHIWHPAASAAGTLASWNSALDSFAALGIPPDPGVTADFSHCGPSWSASVSVAIPRLDLPFSTPPWHGTGGLTRSTRNNTTDQILWTSP
jgi:hypothetical protein